MSRMTRLLGWLADFLAGLVDRHMDNEGSRRRVPVTRPTD